MVDEAPSRTNGRPDREAIRAMFARISPRYDFLNHLLSGGIDRRWRRRAVEAAGPSAPRRVLDTCSGTGDLALAFARARTPPSLVVGCDYTPEMLEIFARKVRRRGPGPTVRVAAGDSLALPFLDASFDVVTAAFGVRNVAVGARGDLKEGLRDAFREMGRVLRPGGRAVILEFSTPRGGWVERGLRFYLERILPVIGNLISGPKETAYGYLPSSVDGFPDGEDFLRILSDAGLAPRFARRLTAGIATLYAAERAPDPGDRAASALGEGGALGLR